MISKDSATNKKVIIRVVRDTYTNTATLGKLFVNDKYVCETLEDTCRDKNRDGDLADLGESKVYGETAIPSGTYELKIFQSPSFKQKLFHLQNVKGFSYVLIHSGNTPIDSKGCIILGLTRGINRVNDSRKALSKFHSLTMNKYQEYKLIVEDLYILV